MTRELRWPVAIALVVAAVTAGPTVARGAWTWAKGQFSDSAESTQLADTNEADDDETGRVTPSEQTRRW